MNYEEYVERMKNDKYKDLVITTPEDKKEYVFISYRSDSWKKVLTEIVYKLQKEYGLRVYFDKAFASETNIWIDQFQENMDSEYCKACLCFFDEGYVTSYATLLELMHAMNARSQLKDAIYPISFDINWKSITSTASTGMGNENPNNPGWKKERKIFDYEFDLIRGQDEYNSVKNHYCEGQTLRKVDCRKIMEILQPKNQRMFVDDDDYYNQFIIAPLKKNCPGVFEELDKPEPKPEPAPVVSTPKPEPAPAVSSPVESVPEKDNKEHVYTIFGKEYRDTVQGQLMYNAYAALIARHPECAEQLTRNTSVARAEHVTNADTKDAHPSYFRKCRSFHVNGVEYLVGIAYGFDAKLVQIRDMFETCGEDPAQFVLNGEPLTPKQGRGRKAKELTADAASKSPSADDFVYTIFGKEYRDSAQGQMMYDAYAALIARHPECAERLTQITSVARAENVTNINTTQARPPYFRRCKSFHVNGIEYLVGISYGFNDKIKQIKGMFKICGEDPEQFAVKSMPELSKRGGGDAAKESSGSPKQGLGELIE